MFKIRRICFHNHPVLGNLSLDFCDNQGHVADTIIIAGENGTGKSTVLNELFSVASQKINFEADVEMEVNDTISKIEFRWNTHSNSKTQYMYAHDGDGIHASITSKSYMKKYGTTGIFSDVDINFHSDPIHSVTSLTLDEKRGSRRSTNDLPTQIKQLMIDIQALDDAEVTRAVELNPDTLCKDLKLYKRMSRFTNAFNRMFNGLKYSRIVNTKGSKSIIFEKDGIEIPIDGLSSGEKQIVYRGCFLLKDVNATNGSFVFIDEPEISLHPNWQKDIMNYYKGIFTDSNGIQTSQIFAVTHSPFIIHNETRRNDKVIILKRSENGSIMVSDKPEYYKCESIEAVQDAFSIKDFSAAKPSIYLEGRTDEKYFKKALEVYSITVPFEFRWVGYIDDRGQEVNTGNTSLDRAFPFLAALNLPVRSICLYDCDTNRQSKQVNNVSIYTMPRFENSKAITCGIENALNFENIDIERFKKQKVEIDGYGIEKRLPDFQKMECCNYICSLDNTVLQEVFMNLRSIIEKLKMEIEK